MDPLNFTSILKTRIIGIELFIKVTSNNNYIKKLYPFYYNNKMH